MNNKGDLISREALRNDLITFFPDKCLEGITAKTLFKQILTDIDNAPTVTPDKIQAIMSDYLVYRCEPQRPQGEWIFRKGVTCGGYYKCNKCGEVERAEKNFCPNCGTDMRKENDNGKS